MQEKLDLILNKLEEISERIVKIEERVEELENDAAAERNDILCEVQNISAFVETMCEFNELGFADLKCENLILLHTNALKTSAFVDAFTHVCGSLTQTNKMTKDMLTPACLSEIIEESHHILIKSDIFSWSDAFENIISDTIATQKAIFAILASDLESIPLSIRTKCGIIE
jgi:hypothetical protein